MQTKLHEEKAFPAGLLADLLEAARIREQLERYLDRYGWDIVEDEEAWRAYQRRKMARDYGNDEW